ncbi:MAG: hypothetical protein LIR47_09990, partial [Spirochaetota bacterium]|nr:hypothetical protein [Spirochaetota bacterium]
MKREASEHRLKHGMVVTVRNLERKDASLAVAYMQTMYASSHFLARDVEEWTITVEEEAEWLTKANNDDKRIILGALCNGQLAGLCDFSPVSTL